jgi:2-oxo-4-hydroxy-4-carboxy--5-ureidoimidazoline (OHCU) decarboxylase
VKIEIREANLYGLDAPKKSDVIAAVTGRALSDEELDAGLARLTSEEQETFMMLLQKFQGRWGEPPAIDDQGVTVETTATNVQPNRAAK